MSSRRTLNHFVWQDCLTPDIDETLSYLEHLVSWSVIDQTWPSIGRYPIVRSDAGAIAGVLEMPKFLQNAGVPSYWTGYVEVGIATAKALVPELGGQLFTLPTTSPMGTTFVFTDCGGALLAAYELSDSFELPSSSRLNEFVWRRLYSKNNAESLQFYSELFGWKLSDDGLRTILDESESVIADMAGPPSWIDQDVWVYFLGVEDLAKTTSALERLGGVVLEDTKVRSRKAVVSKDPRGGVVGFVQME